MANGKTVFYPFWRFDGYITSPEKEAEIKQFLKYFWIGYSIYFLVAIMLTPFVSMLIPFYVDFRLLFIILLMFPCPLYTFKIKRILKGIQKTKMQIPPEKAIENAGLIFTVPRGIMISFIIFIASILIIIDSILNLFHTSEAIGKNLGVLIGLAGIFVSVLILKYLISKRRKIIEGHTL
ncbi:MAG: hypothetical protein FD156_505 [Nitrospirae bacterium]|nr:MAG: hypothetical protein FD156_505 [Nitrospirota bacterium]